jgi:Tol biopolymer transport system component
VKVRRLVRATVVTVSAAGLTVLAPASADAQVERVRMVSESASGEPGDGWSGTRSTEYRGDRRASADGRYVVFDSGADNLGSSPDSYTNVFVKDLSTGEVEQVSVGLGGAAPDGWSDDPSITPDGRFVVFVSAATNLVADTPLWSSHVFRRDLTSGVTELVSHNLGGELSAWEPTVSDDGRYVSYKTNTYDYDFEPWLIYVRDMTAATTTLVNHSVSGGRSDEPGSDPVISGNGRYVAYISAATDLVAGTDPNSTQTQVYRWDRVTDTTVVVSRTSSGTADNYSFNPSISRKGSVIAFASHATNLGIADPQSAQVYVREMVFPDGISAVSLSSDEVEANNGNVEPSISADGRHVAFTSWADNLVPGDTDEAPDVFVRDRQLGTTARVSVSATGVEPDGRSDNPSITADGTQVVFDSRAENLVPDGNNMPDVFIGPADGVQAPVAPLTITDLSCSRSRQATTCTVAYTGGAELVRTTWTANGSPVPAARNRTTMTQRCPLNPIFNLTVRVVLVDDLGTWTQRSVPTFCA